MRSESEYRDALITEVQVMYMPLEQEVFDGVEILQTINYGPLKTLGQKLGSINFMFSPHVIHALEYMGRLLLKRLSLDKYRLDECLRHLEFRLNQLNIVSDDLDDDLSKRLTLIGIIRSNPWFFYVVYTDPSL